MRKVHIVAAAVLFSLPLVFLAIFYFFPLLNILAVGLRPDGEWALSAVRSTLTRPVFWSVLWFTTWQAAASTALTLAIGMPIAYVFAHYQFPGKNVLRAITAIPFVMPTVVVAAAFTALLGDTGMLNRWLETILPGTRAPIQLDRTIWIILLAHTFYNVSIVVRTVGGFWANLSPSLEEAAAVLGAGRIRLLGQITIPLLLPSIAAASLLVFLFCFTSFGVVLILGGLRYSTLEVEIYRQAVSFFNLSVAATLSIVQIIFTYSIMVFYTRLQAKTSLPLEFRPQTTTARSPQTWAGRAVIGGLYCVVLFILLGPLLALAWRSVTLGEDGFTLRHYLELAVNRRQSAFFVAPSVAIRNSILFALATTLLSLTLGVISAYLLTSRRKWWVTILDPLFLLPLGTSAVTLGFGYIISMGTLRTSVWLVPLAHTLIAAPFVVRTLLPALRGLDPRLAESAALLGAPPLRRWWEIDAPILGRAALVGAAFAFTISLGEFGATLLISRPDLPTMPVVIYRALGQPGLANYGQALAMSTLLMLVAGVGLVAIERLRFAEIGEF